MEREIIRERVNAGLVAARQRGRVGGRPSVVTPQRLCLARRLRADVEPSVTTHSDPDHGRCRHYTYLVTTLTTAMNATPDQTVPTEQDTKPVHVAPVRPDGWPD
jgi:hypothetical protein